MRHTPEKPLFSQQWGERQRHYFRQRMEAKWRRKLGIDKRRLA